jgi:tRNA pseudouridine55 synthase
VSALKVGGQRLHVLARAGIEVEREPRPVSVERFEVWPAPSGEQGVFRIEVDCSTGTYIRVLAADLGIALGGGAHLRNLRRTRVGSFGLAESTNLDLLTPAQVLTPAQALRDMPQVEVGSEVTKLVSHGLALDKVALGAAGDGPWAIVDHAGRLLAVYEGTDTDRVVAAVVLASSG